MTHETLLRYPGGKSRAVKYILPHIKAGRVLVSPFIGGGSVELAWLKANPNGIVGAYDSYRPLVSYWQCLLGNPRLLANWVQLHYPMEKDHFNDLQYNLSQYLGLGQAAAFYALNRSSFSGLTNSGGMSPKCERFNQASIDRLGKH